MLLRASLLSQNVPDAAVKPSIANVLTPVGVRDVLAGFCLPAITGVSAVVGVPAIAEISNIPGSADVANILLWKSPFC